MSDVVHEVFLQDSDRGVEVGASQDDSDRSSGGATFYEEPALERTYGDEYRTYKANVRAWIPRPRPWNGAT